MIHTPVLLQEVISFLDPKPGNFVIDGTVDGGGHSAEILARILPGGRLLGIDLDKTMREVAAKRISAKIKDQKSKLKNNLILIHGNYAELPDILRKKKLPKADGLLLDLGFSSEQLESSGRGFGFSPRAHGEPLLMTYDASRTPVREILPQLDEQKLSKIIFELSGERYARRIAKAVSERARRERIETAGELAGIVRDAVPKSYERGRIDPATRTFQALRIYANDELGNLRKVLSDLPDILKKSGRAVIISFHSLEDGLVKARFRELEKEKMLHILTKKPVHASEEEIQRNPRSRSARLRAALLT